MSIIVSGTVEFVIEECVQCRMVFAITRAFEQARRCDHQYFYCPRGHQQYYPAKSDKEILAEKLRAKESECRGWKEERDLAELTLRAVKGHKTRLQKKLAQRNGLR